MPRLVHYSKGCEGVGRLDRHRDGTFHMNERQAKVAMASGEFSISPELSVGKTNEGYRCNDCGFGTWFKTCSRCGGDCFREVEA